MDPIPVAIVALVIATVLLTVWEAYEHARISKLPSDSAPEGLHEWQKGSLETTNGKSIQSYVCERGHDRHVERREV